VIVDYLENNIATNKELQRVSGSNERQILRELKKLGDRIVKIASGKSPKYALTVNAFGVGDRINVWDVDAHGKHRCIAVVRPLSVGGFFVETRTGGSNLLLGEAKNGLYDDLPFFLRDMAPQGFLGRKVAKEIASRDEDYPSNPDYWGTNHIGRYLLSNNDDTLGSLKLGDSANLRLRYHINSSAPRDYPELANAVMFGDVSASSAGGEQPKFTAFCTERQAHVMVKFSPEGDGVTARRWRDVLISEYYANQVLNNGATIAAKTRLVEEGGRLFLESIRFDRHGEQGRSSMLSLKSIDAEFVGTGESWVKSLVHLHEQGLLSEQDLLNGKYLWVFGRLINNTDMHLGNISLSMHGSVFNLLPIYDMCSMGFAPKNNGEVLPFVFTSADLTAANLQESKLNGIKKAANKYWHLMVEDVRVSIELRGELQRFLDLNPE